MPSLTKKQCIAENLKICKFVVSENLKVNGAEPIYEISAFSEVNRYSSIIENVAAESGVDVRLIRSIMYMETTHGYYDAPLSLLGQNKSILPMNVNVDYWGSIFGDRKTLLNPYNNIKAGAEILKRIIVNLPKGSSIRQIATLYNNINANSVNEYGARVDNIYNSQPRNLSNKK